MCALTFVELGILSALKIVDKIIETDESMLHTVIARMSIDQLATLLDYVAQWNTNSRTSSVSMLFCIVKQLFSVSTTHSSSYIRVVHTRTSAQTTEYERVVDITIAIHGTVSAISSYKHIFLCYRHYDRLNRIAQQSSFVNYIWQQTRLSTTI